MQRRIRKEDKNTYKSNFFIVCYIIITTMSAERSLKKSGHNVKRWPLENLNKKSTNFKKTPKN